MLVPERFGVVRGCWRHFLPRPEDDPNFAERMTVRLCTPAFPGDKSTIYHAHQKVAHRADPDVEVERGNHNALGVRTRAAPRLAPDRGAPLLVPLGAQLAQKARGGWMRNAGVEPRRAPDPARPGHRERGRSMRSSRHTWSPTSSSSAELADGTLALDTRLRDALRDSPRPGRDLPAPPANRCSRSTRRSLADAGGVRGRGVRRSRGSTESFAPSSASRRSKRVSRACVDSRGDEARHDTAGEGRGRRHRVVARVPPECGRGLRGRHRQQLEGRDDRGARAVTRARAVSISFASPATTCARTNG